MMISFARTGIVAAAVVALTTGMAAAKDYQAGSLRIENPWARATPKGAKIGGGYVVITNKGSKADKLMGGSLQRANHAELHRMMMDNGIMKMRPVPGGLDIKPGQTVTLSPSGYHLMFMGLKAPLKQGETIPGTLVFEKAGTVPVAFAVEGIAAQGPTPSAGTQGGMKSMKGMNGK